MKENRKRILKNSIYMYIRMIFVLLISLYTSRVVLNILGEDDFGIYVLVGGIVSIFTVMSASLSGSVQRFLSIGLGRSDTEQTKNYFTQSFSLFIIIIGIFFVIAETVGLWFVMNKLNYPHSRDIAVFWVYQFTLFSVFFGILQIPFSGAVIAREKLNIYAATAIADVCIRLLVVILLSKYGSFDNLITYSLAVAIIQISVAIFYIFYTVKKFPECRLKFHFDYKIAKELMNFIGISFFGTTSYTITQQGLNIVLNLFFGPVINAARGIATQVSTAVMRFVSCITVPINPQIVKSYAVGEREDMLFLFERNTKYSLYIMLVLSTPLLLEMRLVLNVWLKEVPDYAILFSQITILEAIVACVTSSASVVISATGKLMRMEVWGRLITLSVLPVSYILLKYCINPSYENAVQNAGVSGGPLLGDIIAQRASVIPLIPLISFFIAQFIYSIYVLADLKTKIDLDIKRYWRKSIKPVLILCLLLWTACGLEAYFMKDDYLRLFAIVFTAIAIAVIYMRKDLKYIWENLIKQ